MVNYPIDYELDEFCYIHLYILDIPKLKNFILIILDLVLFLMGGENGGWTVLELPIKVGLGFNPEVKIDPSHRSLVIGVKDLDKTLDYICQKGIIHDEIQDKPNIVIFQLLRYIW